MSVSFQPDDVKLRLVFVSSFSLMVWSEIGSTPQIQQAGMDGSNRRVLVNKSVSWPVGLTFDLLGDRLYWVDEKLRCIASASLDGENLKVTSEIVFFRTNIFHPPVSLLIEDA